MFYDYAKGGEDWGTLKNADDQVAFSICSEGKKQSPIDLKKSVSARDHTDLEIQLYGYQKAFATEDPCPAYKVKLSSSDNSWVSTAKYVTK